MIGELRAKKLLAAFRGEEPAHAEELIRVLVGLSRLGCEHPEIREVDINPLIITPAGRVKAVDALVVLEEKTSETSPYLPPVAPEDVIAAFTPRSVALIGVSENIRKWGFRIFTGIGAGGYEGKLHLVNPKGGRS